MPQATASPHFSSPRYYAFDALRTMALLSVVVFHCAFSYVTLPLGETWSFKDEQTHFFFDLLILLLHQFQMPIFFVLSGFFGAMLVERRGIRGFWTNRWKRIAVPLIVGWVILFPLTRLATSATLSALNLPPIELKISLIHLWFLYQLLLFYGLSTAIIYWMGRSKRGVEALNRFQTVFGRLLKMRSRLVIFALFSLPPLFLSTNGLQETTSSFTPPLHILLANWLLFSFGWLLYSQREFLEEHFQRRSLLDVTLVLLVCTPFYLWAITRVAPDLPIIVRLTKPSFWCVVITGSLIIWGFVFGLLSVALRAFNRPIGTLRYLADASFWVYLVHLPLTVYLPGVVTASNIGAPLKFTFVLSVTMAVALFTYHFAVRSTIIDRFLNGKSISPAAD